MDKFDYSHGSRNTYLVEERHQMIPRCIHCKQTSKILLDGAQYYAYFMQGKRIAEAFPNLSLEEREHIMTGTHPKCWEEMFADMEEN